MISLLPCLTEMQISDSGCVNDYINKYESMRINNFLPAFHKTEIFKEIFFFCELGAQLAEQKKKRLYVRRRK